MWWPPYHWPFQIVKPSLAEQVGAERVRGQVDRARLPDQVGRCEDEPRPRSARPATGRSAGTTAREAADAGTAEIGGPSPPTSFRRGGRRGGGRRVAEHEGEQASRRRAAAAAVWRLASPASGPGACWTTFTTFVTRTTVDRPVPVGAGLGARAWWSPVTSRTAGTRIARAGQSAEPAHPAPRRARVEPGMRRADATADRLATGCLPHRPLEREQREQEQLEQHRPGHAAGEPRRDRVRHGRTGPATRAARRPWTGLPRSTLRGTPA